MFSRAHSLAGVLVLLVCCTALAQPALRDPPPRPAPAGPPAPLMGGPPGGAVAHGAGACAVPDDLMATAPGLPAVARALRPGGTLDILAIGSAPVGPRMSAEDTFPEQAVRLLRQAAPTTTITLRTVRDRAATAADMLASLRRELASRPAALVLWQTGTVDSVRRIPPEAFARALSEGIRIARAAGSDVVLVDPQFSRVLQSHADIAPYEALLTSAGSRDGVALFPRYALMRRWVATGGMDVERADRPDRRRAVASLHACLAAALSRTIQLHAGGARPGLAGRETVP